MKYYIGYRVSARYIAEVEADSLEEAKANANAEYCDADFGVAEDIDAEQVYVEDAAGHRIWEK